MDKYFVLNLETEKLNIYTGGKAEWFKISEADRKEISRACLFAKSLPGWVSRGKTGSYNVDSLRKKLVELGFEDRGTEGERLSFSEQVERQQERAEERAERYEDRSDTASHRADSHFKTFHSMMDAIPFGQPILVGHHSENRDRNYRNRACGHAEKGVRESDKAKYYSGRATTARATADGSKYSDPRYLGNRIEESQKELRDIDNRLAKYTGPEHEEYRERLAELREREQDKLDFHLHCLETCGKTIWTKETLKGMTHVQIRGRWEEIVKLNPKTVSVPNICMQDRESQIKWAMKYPYTEVQDARKIEAEEKAS